MAFTYSASLSTDRDKVRFYIGDTSNGAGVKPGAGNFADAEIDGLVTIEGSWQGAVAAAYEVLAAEYARYVDISAGPVRESLGQAAARYSAMATEWRKRTGHSGRSTGSRSMTRVDGYSDDVASDEV